MATIAVVWLAIAGSAPACGCAVALGARALTDRALVTYHAGTETIVPGLSLTSVGPHAAVLVPVPAVPRVRVLRGVDDLFGELESTTAPKHSPSVPQRRANLVGPLGAVEHHIIRGYEVSVLRGGGVAGLVGWLSRYGYALPSKAEPILRAYVREHWRFVVIRLARQPAGDLRPLAISFRTRRIIYPMRLAAIASKPVSVELFVDADGVAYASGVSLGLTSAGSVAHLAPGTSAAVRALLPGRYLTRFYASDVRPRSIHGDVILRSQTTRGRERSGGICGLCVLEPLRRSLTDTGNGVVAVKGAPIIVDSADTPAVRLTGNGTITAPLVGVVGSVSITGHGTIHNLRTGIHPVPDPLAGLHAPSVARPTSVPSVIVSGNSTRTISPGVYREISVRGTGRLTLNPGTYVILRHFSSTGHSRVAGKGVTLYLACASYPTPCGAGAEGAGLSLAGNGSFNLGGPTSGCLPTAIYSDPTNVSEINLSGNGDDTITGIVYARSGSAVLTGSGSPFNLAGHVIVRRATLRGNGNITLAASNLIACTLTLSPGTAGPNVIGSSQELEAAVVSDDGSPVSGQRVDFTITGANPTTGSATTDASGIAKFTYKGTNVGRDTAQASLTEGATLLRSNTSTITWATGTPQISTKPSATVITVGESVSDAASVVGGFSPGGSVSWSVYGASDTTCQKPLNASPLTAPLSGGSATSPSYTPTAAGTYQFVATYSDDQTNRSVSTKCADPAEQVVVNQATPQISTRLSASVITVGESVSDTASVAGGFSPGGSVSWSVYGASDTTCQKPLNASPLTTPLSGGSATSPSYTPTAAGTYQFVATYSGDQTNRSVSTKCADPAEQVVVNSAAAASPVFTTAVQGNFYTADPSAQTFTAKPGDTPAFGQDFPTIDFNPPNSNALGAGGVGGGLANPAGSVQYTPPTVNPSTRPFTDVTTNVGGAFTGTVVAQGNGQQAGVGSLTSFDAALTATFVVAKAGDVTFTIVHDDGFLLGIGGGAMGVSGVYKNAPASSGSAFHNYPLVGAFDATTGASPATDSVTVHFPKAGTYPYELDYFDCCGRQLSLSMTVSSFTPDTAPYAVYSGYADTVRPPGASSFPFPWQGSPNTTFVGSGPPYDTGALRVDNDTASPLPLSHVTVDIGPAHVDPGFANLSIPPRSSLILAGTNGNFDTSDSAASAPAASAPAASAPAASAPAASAATSVTLSRIASGFPTPIGIDYYEPTNGVVMSVNYSGGQPNNFDLVDSNGNFTQFSHVGGLTDEVYLAAIRSSSCEGGFTPGDVYFGTGQSGVIARLSNGGNTLTDPWVTLPNESGLLAGGLFQDIYCVAGGDLIVTTRAGDVWRVSSNGAAKELASNFGASWLEGPTTVPNDSTRYGPWAGQILASDESNGVIWSIDPTTGATNRWNGGGAWGAAEGVRVVPPNQNFFGVDYGSGTLRGAAASQFTNVVGDVVLATESGGKLLDITWNGTSFQSYDLLTSDAAQWEGTTFAPAGIAPITPTCVPSTAVPQINVTTGSGTATYADDGLALVAGGKDGEVCGNNESQPWRRVGGTGVALSTPLPPAISLTLSPSSLPGDTVDTRQALDVTALDDTGKPLAGLPVSLGISGANSAQLQGTTDATGKVALSYSGTNAGTDVITATAFVSGREATSNALTLTWSIPVPAPAGAASGNAPSIFNVSPVDQSSVTAQTPVTANIQAATGDSISSWSLTSQLLPGGSVTVLASGSGPPPSTLGTFDPSSQAPGTYALTISATAAGGGSRSVVVRVIITGSPAAPGGTNPGGGTTAQAPPSISAITPADGARVTKPVPVTATITPPSGATIASWKVTVQALDPEPPVVLASGSGTPPSTLATFDPTLLPNDTYQISVSATASGGGTQTQSSTVAVLGNLKLGRYATTYQDLVAPVNGFQMAVRRVYDSIDKRSGDFGVGWHVELSNFRVSANRQLGAGGWTEYTTNCFILCSWAYTTSTPHFVTVTFPDGHQEVFDFTPKGPQRTLIDFAQATTQFTASAVNGNTDTLQDGGGAVTLGYGFDGNLYDASGGIYNPTRFTLTTHDGRTLILDTQLGLVSEADRSGNSLSVDSGGVHSTLGPAPGTPGPSITFTRDASNGNRITDITGPLSGQHLHYGYDANGRLSAVTDPNGNTDTYSYDPTTGELNVVSDPNGKPIQTLAYGSDGRLFSIANGSGSPTIIGTNVAAQQQTLFDPNGKLTTVLSYDDLGDVVQRVDSFGSKTLTTKYTYDAVGRTTSVTDPLGEQTIITYDESSGPSNGNVLSVSSAGRTWSLTKYNSFGEPGEIDKPDGSVQMTFSYDTTTGAVRTEDQPGQPPTTLSYWPAGQLKSVTDPGGRSVNYTYDSNGNLATIYSSSGNMQAPPVNLQIDAAGELRSVTDQIGNQTKYDYYPNGALKVLTDGNQKQWQYFYDPFERLHQVEDPLGKFVTYDYNDLGLLAQVTDRNNNITTYGYDQQPAGATSAAFTDGLLTQEVRPGNDVVNYNYDPFGRLIEADDVSSHIDRTYDDAGRLATERTCANTGSPATACGKVASTTQPDVQLKYAYEPDSQLKSVTSSDSGTPNLQYGYDGLGRLASIQAGTQTSFGIGYDALSRVQSLSRPNGITDTFQYNASNDLTNRDASRGGTPVTHFDYGIDPVTGRRMSLTDNSGVHTFDYYDNGWLKAATHPAGSGLSNESYAYDPVGNRTTGTGVVGIASYDAVDRLLSDGRFNYTYDGEGDLRTKTPVGVGPATTYDWNSDHQLTAIHYPDGTTSTYRYDPFGTRVAAVDNGNEARFVDGTAVGADYNGQNQLQASYLSGLESVSGAGQPTYYLTDGLGSARALTDSAGNVTGTYSYDGFGVPSAGNASPGRQTFTGYQYDRASGLYDAGARYYDPTTGRFLSEDPVPSANPYPYAANNPTNLIDIYGLQAAGEYAEILQTQVNTGQCIAGAVGSVAGTSLAAVGLGLEGYAPRAEDVIAAIQEELILNGAECVANQVAQSATAGGHAPCGECTYGQAQSWSFLRTESLKGRESSSKVAAYAESMRVNGWQGEPIEVARNGDDLYIINGHHRVAAAARAGINVPYRVLTDDALQQYGYGGINDVISAWASAGPNRLR